MSNKKFDDIEIPENIDLRIRQGIEDGTCIRENRKSRLVRYALCASILFMILIKVDYSIIADRLPFLNDVFKEMENSDYNDFSEIRVNEYFDKYGKIINQTEKSNGISITVEEVVCDGKDIIISYIIKGDSKLGDDINSTSINVSQNGIAHINGLQYSVGGEGYIDGMYIDEYTFIGMQKMTIGNLESVKDNFVVYIDFSSVADADYGDWQFEFIVDVNGEHNKIIEINETKGDYTVSKVEINPFSTRIEYIIPNESEDTYYEMMIVDDKGVVINELSGSVKVEGEYSKWKKELIGIDKDCKYIDIIFKEFGKEKNHIMPGYKLVEKENNKDVKFRVNLN